MSMETKLRAPQGSRPEGYERSDADVRSLLKFGFSLLVIIVVVCIAMKFMFSYFAESQLLGPPASPFENARVLPPQPRLQVHPGLELQAYCEAQERELDSYGWVDPHNEVVRIPVDRAMDLILQRGLPARSAANGAPGGIAAAEVAAMPSAPPVNGSQGPCGYLVKTPAQDEK